MSKLSSGEILIELGAESLDGSGFEREEPEIQDENTITDPEVAQ